jgi:hydrogenase-4 membrane subunit HyfE
MLPYKKLLLVGTCLWAVSALVIAGLFFYAMEKDVQHLPDGTVVTYKRWTAQKETKALAAFRLENLQTGLAAGAVCSTIPFSLLLTFLAIFAFAHRYTKHTPPSRPEASWPPE